MKLIKYIFESSNWGFRCAISLDSRQDEHEEIMVKRGENEALQWEDYKSMSFTQCVSTF